MTRKRFAAGAAEGAAAGSVEGKKRGKCESLTVVQMSRFRRKKRMQV